MKKTIVTIGLVIAVLIETYWNVNVTMFFPILTTCFVLIETYWNVN